MTPHSLHLRDVGGAAARLVTVASLAAGMLALTAGPAGAVTCPTVDPVTHAVSPPPSPGVDWSGCDLSDANLTQANLAGAKLAGTGLADARLSFATLHQANLTSADLTGAVLAGTDLTDAVLTSASLRTATLNKTKLADASLGQATFAGARLYLVTSGGITGTPASLPVNWSLAAGYLVGPFANLTGASLAGADLAGADLTSASALDVNLSGANLTSTDLHFALLGSGNLTDANLTGADLTVANLGDATLTGATLAGATMNYVTILAGVVSGQIAGSPAALPPNWTLVDGYLIGPDDDLVNASLAGATLAGADLGRSDLSGADLTGANLTGADLAVTSLSGTKLAGATLTELESGQISGTPASLPAHWVLVDGYLVGPKVILINATLPGANLSGLDLAAAYAYYANLAGASLDHANLAAASFINSNLTAATFTGATLTGVYWSATTCPDGSNSDKHLAGCFSPLDTTPPIVTVTGVRAGHVYVIGSVPAAGCSTTDDSFVSVPATLKVTTTGQHGVGLFTARCSGAVDRAGNQAAPVSVTYKVVYGFGGFTSPAPGSTVARSRQTITVTFRLTGAFGAVISARIAAALASAHEVRVTLRGPDITAVTALCAWDATRGRFRCVVGIPAGVRTGTSHRYTISAQENPQTGFVLAPGAGQAVNPEIIHFS